MPITDLLKTEEREDQKDKGNSPQSANIKQLAAPGNIQTTVSRVTWQPVRIAGDHNSESQSRCFSNYQPNAFARGLRKKRSFTVGVLVPEISEDMHRPCSAAWGFA